MSDPASSLDFSALFSAVCWLPVSVLMLTVGIDSMSMCPAERKPLSLFLVFQSLTAITVIGLRVLIYIICKRTKIKHPNLEGSREIPGVGPVCSISYILTSIAVVWTIKFTSTIATLDPVPELKEDDMHCPAYLYYITLTYCCFVSLMSGLMVLVVLTGLAVGVARPDLLVTTGFLKDQNFLIDFADDAEEEKDKDVKVEPKWNAALAIEGLTGQEVGKLSPSWAKLALGPVNLQQVLQHRLDDGINQHRNQLRRDASTETGIFLRSERMSPLVSWRDKARTR